MRLVSMASAIIEGVHKIRLEHKMHTIIMMAYIIYSIVLVTLKTRVVWLTFSPAKYSESDYQIQ